MRGDKANTEKINIKELEETYKPDDTLFSEEDEYMNILKGIVFNDLTEPEKRIILLYAELGSQRKVGDMLGVSPATANLTIRRIQNKIKTKLKSLC